MQGTNHVLHHAERSGQQYIKMRLDLLKEFVGAD